MAPQETDPIESINDSQQAEKLIFNRTGLAYKDKTESAVEPVDNATSKKKNSNSAISKAR